MAMPDRACGLCKVADIPWACDWLWWDNGQPIHPWCDQAIWSKISERARREIKLMVRKVLAAS